MEKQRLVVANYPDGRGECDHYAVEGHRYHRTDAGAERCLDAFNRRRIDADLPVYVYAVELGDDGMYHPQI